MTDKWLWLSSFLCFSCMRRLILIRIWSSWNTEDLQIKISPSESSETPTSWTLGYGTIPENSTYRFCCLYRYILFSSIFTHASYRKKRSNITFQNIIHVINSCLVRNKPTCSFVIEWKMLVIFDNSDIR